MLDRDKEAIKEIVKAELKAAADKDTPERTVTLKHVDIGESVEVTLTGPDALDALTARAEAMLSATRTGGRTQPRGADYV